MAWKTARTQKVLNLLNSQCSIVSSLVGGPTSYRKLTLVSPARPNQWHSQEGARGSNCPQTAVLPPNKFTWKTFWFHLRLMYPQNVTMGVKNEFLARFAASYSSGAVSDCDGWLSTVTSNYCHLPLKMFSRPPTISVVWLRVWTRLIDW